MRSLNIKSTPNSVMRDGRHRLRANGFEFRPLNAAYSDAATSFQPLTLFALLGHFGFQSFEYPTTLTTTCAPSFIFSLIIILSFRNVGPTELHGGPHGSSTLLKRRDAQYGIARLPAL